MSDKVRNLVVVLGDQLNADAAAFDEFDDDQDAVWMAEVTEESTHVWTNKPRIAVFLAAMRHFRDDRQGEGKRVIYQELRKNSKDGALAEQLVRDLKQSKPEKVVLTRPGEFRVLESLKQAAADSGVEFELREDRHFLSTPADFEEHAKGRKSLRMEYFYREMRKRYGVLLTKQGKPEGGDWNYDADNRDSFGRDGPGDLPDPVTCHPDETTREVIDLVKARFKDHPGSLDDFRWAVTRRQALAALDDFIKRRLVHFGDYQDAMWTGEPFLYHSLISSSLNLKLLDPREVIERAEKAYREDGAPLAAVEGFIRQILGWREYVRGVYWKFMPEYRERNELEAEQPLPEFFWTGETDMRCLRESIEQTLRYGYAHHIQRLMVTGLYALLLGVRPQAVHEWYLAVYVDAVEWVELPNTLGMSQYGDGGVMASKPYAATGKYIQRMSNYCSNCRFDPKMASGEQACPFTTLYWDFLARHRERLKDNRRMNLQLRNIERKKDTELKAIREQADFIRQHPAMTCSAETMQETLSL